MGTAKVGVKSAWVFRLIAVVAVLLVFVVHASIHMSILESVATLYDNSDKYQC